MKISSLLLFSIVFLTLSFSVLSKDAPSAILQLLQNQNPSCQYLGLVNFFNTGLMAKDVAMSPEGFIMAVGVDGKLYKYNEKQNTYSEIKGKSQMNAFQRIALDPEAKPYLITTSGSIYYLDCNLNWVKLPGCARDIAISKNNEIWKIGCDAQDDGCDSEQTNYGIWKLFCKSNEKCACGKKCFTFRKDWVDRCDCDEAPTCEWIRISGHGVRIAVKPDGDPVVLDKEGQVYEKTEHGWVLREGVLGVDIATSNDGEIFVAGQQNFLFKLIKNDDEDCEEKKWLKILGNALALASGPYGELVTIDNSQKVYTSTKLGFN
jgi:hypothetical protein